MLGDHFDRPFHRCFVEESTGVDGSMLESTPHRCCVDRCSQLVVLASCSQLARDLVANHLQAARKSLATRLQLASQSIFRGSEMLPQTDKIDPRGVKIRQERPETPQTALGAPF